MMTQSGCFGSTGIVDPIDDAQEVAQSVGEILQDVQPVATQSAATEPTVFALSVVFSRLRMLTWAVVVIAIYLFLSRQKT